MKDRYIEIEKICKIRTGFRDVNEGSPDGQYPFFTCAAEPLKSATYSFDGPSILLPGNGANVGLASYYNGKLEAYQRTYVLNEFKDSLPKYVYYYFKAFWKQINQTGQFGSATNYIRYDNIAKFKIVLPSLDIQENVIKLLEKVETIKKKRKEANRLTDEFLKFTFLAMFGDPNNSNRNYPIKKIGDVIERIQNENPLEYPDKNYLYIDISSIDNKTKRVVSLKSLNGIDAPSRARQLVKTKDILASTVRPNLNAVAMILTKEDNLIASTGFCILRVKSDIINEAYFFEICKQPFFIETLTKLAKGASYPAVTDKEILNITIPIPPKSEQDKFADIVRKTEKLKSKQQEAEKELDNLFNSIMQKAFNGKDVMNIKKTIEEIEK